MLRCGLRRDSVMRCGHAWVGCSGWQNKHWRGTLSGEPAVSQWFDYLRAAVLDTVEMTVASIAWERATFAAWSRRAPARLYSPSRRAASCPYEEAEESRRAVDRLFARVRGLHKHLGPVSISFRQVGERTSSASRIFSTHFRAMSDTSSSSVTHRGTHRRSARSWSPPRVDVPSRYARVGDREGSRRPRYVRFRRDRQGPRARIRANGCADGRRG